MASLLNDVTNFITGKSDVLPNPDPALNIQILEEARNKIETGIFTRFLKRPMVYILESVSYIVSIFLFIVAIYIWSRIDNIFDTIDTINFFNQLFSNQNLIASDYDWISYALLIIFLLPSIICFLLARLFTKSRKRTAIFIEVEELIDHALYNLKG